MKYKILILKAILLCSCKLFSQQEKLPLPKFNEVQINYNHTPTFFNKEGRFGFGLGLNKSFRKEKLMNLMLGVGYNYTQYFSDYIYENHFAHYENIQFYSNHLSVLAASRFVFGNQIKDFFELGYYLDFGVYNRNIATLHTYYPDSNSVMVLKTSEVKNKIQTNNFTHGIQVGLGLQLPYKKKSILLKASYKFAFIPIYEHGHKTSYNYTQFSLIYGW